MDVDLENRVRPKRNVQPPHRFRVEKDNARQEVILLPDADVSDVDNCSETEDEVESSQSSDTEEEETESSEDESVEKVGSKYKFRKEDLSPQVLPWLAERNELLWLCIL